MRIIRKYKKFIFWVYCYRDIFVIYSIKRNFAIIQKDDIYGTYH